MIPDRDRSSATDRDLRSRLSPSAQSAQEQIDSGLIDAPLQKYERIIPFLVLFALLGFVVFSCIAIYFSNATYAKWLDPSPILWLVLLTTSFGIWFILAFTGSPVSRAKQRECFRFAYSFTITTFIILVFPYLNLWKPDIQGPIGLVRGCIYVDTSTERPQEPVGPRSVSCTPAIDDKVGDKPAGKSNDKPGTLTYAYPWLLTIGGFVGTTVCKSENGKCDLTDPDRHSEIKNGLVVPFYVVFLAFIGGAVSLSRRIPEYQKRAAEGYVPASDLAALSVLKPHEAREAVVFQIMQLISAPFIAITAYWAIAPSTVPASIGLAFVSGFASETILLLIRGVVDGVRPQTSLFAGAKKLPDKSDPTADAGHSSDATPATVTVRLAVHADLPLDAGSLALTVDAAVVTLSPDGFVEQPLEVGRAHALVATGRSNGEMLRAEMTFTPTLDDEGKPVTLDLVRKQP